MMQKMQAFVRMSSLDQNVELAEIPVPEIGEYEVLVKVEAFGVGLHDRYFIPEDAVFPYAIGTEASGIIVKAGKNITQFQTGDRVILTSILQAKGGCWAEYVTVPQDALLSLPTSMEFTVGAAISVAGKTALESMRALDLHSGDTLFVAGASGAIGTLVIQLAAARGIRVIGSASQRNHEYMLSLGAEMAVDYSDPNWKQEVGRWQAEGVSAALAIQPGTAKDSVDVVKDGGKVVTVSGDEAASERNIAVFQFQHHDDNQPAMTRLVSDIAEGRIRLVIEQIYPFQQALDALEKAETRHARGKVAVTLDGM